MRRWLIGLIGGLIAALAVAGCSGDDSTSRESTIDPDGDADAGALDAAGSRATETVAPPPAGNEEQPEQGSTPVPVVVAPLSGGGGVVQTATPIDLAARGYVEEEYLVSGDATSYQAAGEWTIDGRWEVEAASTAPFASRIVVRRPADAGDYNGTTIVEWFNNTSDVDIDIDFVFASEELLRGGYAWVGVSAQSAGVNEDGSDSPFGTGALGLKQWDPVRYAALDHPGDDYSYDIFTRVGAVLRSPGEVDPLDGLGVQELLATGESQSAIRLLTYANAIHPVVGVYDGILIHSRDGSGAPLAGDAMVDASVPVAARIRDDLDIPVLQVETETDLYVLGTGRPFPPARQADTDLVRTWEMAGTAHSDSFYLARLSEQGTSQFEGFLDLSGVLDQMNSGPQNFLMNAAVRALRSWVSEGTPPPEAQPLETVSETIVRDRYGNALGGVRTPHVDVPVSTLTGEGLSVVGRTIPFDSATLAALYPTEQAYMETFAASLDRAIAAGFLLADDRAQIVDDAVSEFRRSG